ncbi:TIGR03364 family FAD-dependent oxidoreductase [Microbulbifer taiwanensis]|uniref:TIGR03364 family FAD-dependent oxidoreductase n=1 Tax=Microbulbifer taiwanensis TaxID=986746 RepID=A0ABW1YM62_9GAMM|nr:TIGR03364 family FAD-dependent oxidoreductase [Microbulbifer taiwanensis]
MKFDLAIVGAGVLGSFAALRALHSGKKVLLLEAGERARGATVRNFGQIIPSGMAPGTWRGLGLRSLEIYRSLEPKMDGALWQQGSLYIASSPEEATLLEEMQDINRDTGVESELLTPAQCLARIPALQPGYCCGGLFYPREMSAESGLLMPRLWQLLAADPNLTLKPATAVAGVEESGDGATVTTAVGERFSCRQVLVCCGHLLNRLFPQHLQIDTVQISKLQMLRTEPLKPVKIPGNLLTGLSIRRYDAFKSCPSYRSLPDSGLDPRYGELGIHMLFRQSADGSLIVGDSHEYFSAQGVDSLDYEIRQDINDLMLAEAQRILALPQWKITRAWNGFYSQENQRGVLLKSISPAVHLATGIGGKGMSTGPALMERAVDSLLAGRPLEECLEQIQ